MKKFLSILLCMALMASMFCITAYAADPSTAPADAIVNEDGSKTWYADGVTYTAYPSVDVAFDTTAELEGYEVVLEEVDGITPYGPVSEVKTVAYSYALYDADGNLSARYTITVSGRFSHSTLLAEIESISCKFTYKASSGYNASTTWSGNTGTVRILLSGVAVKKYSYRLNTDGTVNEI